MQAGDVNDAIIAAMTAVNALTDESDADTVKAARDLVAAAQTELDGADKMSSDDVATEQGRIDALDTSVGGHETRLADADAAAKVVADTKKALTKETAISAEAEQGTDAGLGGTGVTVSPSGTAGTGDYSLDIERDRGRHDHYGDGTCRC